MHDITKNKHVWIQRVLLLLLIVPVLLVLSGCFKSYNEMVLDAYEKEPNYYKSVKPQERLAIDGVWKNPFIGYNFHMDRGRFIMLDETSSTGPGFHTVTVRDIKRVASGRYRGTDFKTGKKVTYSIVTENKLLERSIINGMRIDGVYDKVFVKDEKWFMNEYQSFLEETK